MFRIYKDNATYIDVNGTEMPKPVVLMQHGLADSSDSFIINYKDKAPAFIAAT